MVGVRLPAIFLRKIDKMAAKIGANRSMIIRLMVEHALGHGSPEVVVRGSLLITSLLGWKGRRGGVADRIASAVLENPEGLAKAYLAARREPKTKARRDNTIEKTPSRPRLPRT
jgi:Ribbon-helix-helix protein, copG family